MKSVLRSAFDPVPRPLSPGAQLLVVGVLVVGITISVVEYLESSKPASVVQQPAAQPVRVETETSARLPVREAAQAPHGLVRASSRGGAASSAPSASAQPFPGSAGVETSPGAVAPMTLQPDGDS